MPAKLQVSRRLRATPYTPCVEALGVSGFSVVNHTILPKGFRHTQAEDYWHLKQHVQLWDVGCQRQVEINGPDASKLVQLMTPRDLSRAGVGQCLYAPLVDEQGKMLNDPIILKLAEDRFWLSIADSDVLLWAKGLAVGMALQAGVHEPDVWPLGVQGPRAEDLMASVFGSSVRDIQFFRFAYLPFQGHELLIARSGYSKQGGFEIYLHKPEIGADLWDTLFAAGRQFNVRPGCPNLIERVEGGLLSYGNEMTMNDNPLQCGLSQYCQLDGSVGFLGLEALQEVAQMGPDRLIKGVIFDGAACPPCQHPWGVSHDGTEIGYVTTAIWSPRYDNNVALAMIDKGYWTAGMRVFVAVSDGSIRNGIIVDLPMADQPPGLETLATANQGQ